MARKTPKTTETKYAPVRSFTNHTKRRVYVVLVHGEPCSEILQHKINTAATYKEWPDAADAADGLQEGTGISGTDIVGLAPGETLDLDVGW